MTVRARFTLLMGAFVCASIAFWGAHQMFERAFDPILKALGA